MTGAKFTRTSAVVLALASTMNGCRSTSTAAEPVADSKAAAASPTPTVQAPVIGTSPAPMMGMMGGWHYASPYGQLYFQGKPIVFDGEIRKTAPTLPLPNMSQGVQIIVASSTGERIVHLGPAWYINAQEFVLNPGQKVKISGRTVTIAGQSIVMAEKIQSGSETLQLRDNQGFPLWAGHRSQMHMGPSGRRMMGR